MNTQRYVPSLLLAGALLLPAAAIAATDTANLSVSIQIDAKCEIDAATLTFAPQTDLATQVTASASIPVTCSNTTFYEIGFGLGLNDQGSQRRMKNTASNNYINYQIYKDDQYLTILDEVGNPGAITGTGTGTSQTITIHGRIPVQSTPMVGLYQDTVLMTIDY